MAIDETPKETKGQLPSDIEVLKLDTQPKGYLHNITGWINNKLGTTKDTEKCIIETSRMAGIETTKESSGQNTPGKEVLKPETITQPKGYLHNITGWVNNKLGTTKDTEKCIIETSRIADIETTKESSGQNTPGKEVLKPETFTQPREYLHNITEWVNNKLGTTKDTEKSIIENTSDDTQVIKRPVYLQYLSMGWVKDKLSNVSNSNISNKETLTKEPGSEIAKPTGYLQYLSLGWVKDKMAGGINPFVTKNTNKQVEYDPKEETNGKKESSGYLSYLSLVWVKDRMAGNSNPYDVCAVPPPSKDDENINAGVWDKIKFDNEYMLINKDKVKEYMPDMKTVENTSDVVKTVGELTGLPFLQGIGTIIKKGCTLSRQVTVLGSKEEEDLKTKIEDVIITKSMTSNEPNLYSEVIEKLKSGELNFEMIKLILEMSEFQDHKLKELHRFPNLYYRSSYSTYSIMTHIYQRDEDYIYNRRRFW